MAMDCFSCFFGFPIDDYARSWWEQGRLHEVFPVRGWLFSRRRSLIPSSALASFLFLGWW